MVYRMTKIISPSCMQLKIVRIHLPLMICVLVDKHYGIGGILLCYPTRRRPILSMLFRCAIAIGLGLPLSLYPCSRMAPRASFSISFLYPVAEICNSRKERLLFL